MTSTWGLLKWAKRTLIEALQTCRLTRMFQDVDCFLGNIDVRRGPPVNATRALVLSPHPDDEAIGCGGTLALLTKGGSEVDIVHMTSGGLGGDMSLVKVREAEARTSAMLLGTQTLTFLGGKDGELHLQHWLVDSVIELLNKKAYSVIFCPWPHDGHSDHAATFQIFKKALSHCKHSPEIWLYEVWSPLIANHVVDIDSVIDLKCRAIEQHQSQTDQIDYTQKFLSLSAYRSLICRPAQHAEAFFVCGPAKIAQMGKSRVF